MKNTIFRSDLELLRGIAVLLVVLFHLKISFFSSGFIGVDIFFVLSGYLMASALCGAAPEKILDFYERRARRVLPAALIILIIFYLITPFIFLPFEIKKIEDSYLGILFFIPNVIFWRDDDYFSDINFSPLLHYWSLGIELQYYLMFPLIVLFLKKNQKAYLLLAAASIVASIIITQLDSKSAFFLFPTRLWEFLAGYFAFILCSRAALNQLENKLRYMLCLLACLLALLALLITSVSAIPQNKYPGYYALLPAMFSFIFIIVGVKDKLLEKIPGVSVIRWIGRLSYSIYLVHFPVIFYFLYNPFVKSTQLDIVQQCYAAITTLILSVISYYWIETPLRNRKLISKKVFFLGLFFIYILALSIYFTFKYFNYFDSFYNSTDRAVFQAFTDQGQARCSKLQKLKEFGETSCALFKPIRANKTIYLVGDSQIDALKEAFIDEAEKHSVGLRLNRSRCYLGQGQCSQSEIIEQIHKYNITDVVMHGWDYSKFSYENLQELISWASKNKVNIHFVGPVPTYADSVPKFLYDEIKDPKVINIRINYDQYNASVYSGYKKFVAFNEGKKHVFFYDSGVYFCPLKKDCLLDDKNGVFYFDSHHPTITGAQILRPMIKEIYEK